MKGRMWKRLRWFEICVALMGAVAFAIVGPFRETFAALPQVLVGGASILFIVPGALVARWVLGAYFPGVALLPAAFIISLSAFALLGVPMLISQSSLGAYLLASGAMVAVFLLAAAGVALLHALRGKPPSLEQGGDPVDAALGKERGGLLWVPFALLVGVWVYVCRVNTLTPYRDVWIYLSWVRQFLSGEGLATEEPYFGEAVGLSRVRINGWLLEQAAFSRVSGVDPVDLVVSYITPALAVVALLAFYALARTLLESERAALFCGCLYALFLLVHLDSTSVSFGGEFVNRLAEDKLVTKFIFLPMTLAFAVAFSKGGGRVYFWCFALVCCAVMAVHPIGLAIIGISMAGFAMAHLAFNARNRQSWVRMAAMAAAGLLVVAVPAALVLGFTGEPLTAVITDSDINSNDPDVLHNMVFVKGLGRIFELANGSYMMHPSLILNPAIAAAFILGLPFLLWRLRRSTAAQLLLGSLCLTSVLVYVPPVATFLGENLVLPGQIWRLAWPIQLAALLTVGWLAWELINRVGAYASARFGGVRLARPFIRSLPLLLVVVLTVAAMPTATAGIKDVSSAPQAARSAGVYPEDPIYPWLREELRPPGSRPVVVMAPELESALIPAYSSEANVISRRGGLVLNMLPALKERALGQIEIPQGALDIKRFFSGITIPEAARILGRHHIDYVMVKTSSPVNENMDRRPVFHSVKEPSKNYEVYDVDLRGLERLAEIESSRRAGGGNVLRRIPRRPLSPR